MAETAAQAAKLLNKFGEAVTVTFPGTAGFDPITGEPTTPSSGNSYTAKGYAGQYLSSDIDGTVIQQNDIRLIMQLILVRPEVGCTALVDGTTYRIMDVQAIRKSGVDVIYICQLRAN
jgi:hypothetical protein